MTHDLPRTTETAESPNALGLRVNDVEAGYGDIVVLRQVSLEVLPGTVVALLGTNGAGKTTLLRVISGFLPARAGSVVLGDSNITSWKPHRRARVGLCHVPEGRGVFRSLSVHENLDMQLNGKQDSEALEVVLTAFPALRRRWKEQAGLLSGGEQQMLAMAAAYMRRPSLILVDEASLGLAPKVTDSIFSFLADRAAGGASLLIVDQFVARALAISSTAYVLNRGVITYHGPSDVLEDDDLFAHYVADDNAADGSETDVV